MVATATATTVADSAARAALREAAVGAERAVANRAGRRASYAEDLVAAFDVRGPSGVV